jgi:hypothetical protein
MALIDSVDPQPASQGYSHNLRLWSELQILELQGVYN